MMDNEKIYDGVINLAVQNNSHTKAFTYIAENSSAKGRILEVGCSKGYFGACLSDKGYEVWGVEPSNAAAKIAENYLHKVHHGDINGFFESNDGLQFDHIVFGDVIEHLLNPEEILIRSSAFLAPEGNIIASIPNVAHMAVRVMLFEGRWEYAEQGILDDTHLRFYTRQSILDLFTKSGYRVEKIDCVRLPVDTVSEMCEMNIDQSLLAHLEPLAKDDDKDVFQFVIKAIVDDSPCTMATNNKTQFSRISKTEDAVRPETNVLCIVPFHDSTLSTIRLINPLRAWASAYSGCAVRVVAINEITSADILWADVAVYQREANEYSLRMVKEMQRVGIPLVFDLDDLLIEVPEFSSVYEHALRSRENLLEILRLADIVTVTEYRLAENIKEINPKVRIIPNCADPLPFSNGHDDQGVVSLLVASSDTVRVDFIRDVLLSVKSELGSKIEIIGIGPPGEWLRKKGVAVQVHPNMPYDEFKKFVSEIKNAIGLIPLDNSEFSSCKTPIKFIEYSLGSVPSICSNVPTYADYVIHENTGILVENSYDAWFDAVMDLTASAAKRTTIVDAAIADCLEKFSMSRSAEAWNILFDELVDKEKSSAQKSAQRMIAAQGDKLFANSRNIYQKIYGVVKSDGLSGLLSIARRKAALALRL